MTKRKKHHCDSTAFQTFNKNVRRKLFVSSNRRSNANYTYNGCRRNQVTEENATSSPSPFSNSSVSNQFSSQSTGRANDKVSINRQNRQIKNNDQISNESSNRSNKKGNHKTKTSNSCYKTPFPNTKNCSTIVTPSKISLSSVTTSDNTSNNTATQSHKRRRRRRKRRRQQKQQPKQNQQDPYNIPSTNNTTTSTVNAPTNQQRKERNQQHHNRQEKKFAEIEVLESSPLSSIFSRFKHESVPISIIPDPHATTKRVQNDRKRNCTEMAMGVTTEDVSTPRCNFISSKDATTASASTMVCPSSSAPSSNESNNSHQVDDSKEIVTNLNLLHKSNGAIHNSNDHNDKNELEIVLDLLTIQESDRQAMKAAGFTSIQKIINCTTQEYQTIQTKYNLSIRATQDLINFRKRCNKFYNRHKRYPLIGSSDFNFLPLTNALIKLHFSGNLSKLTDDKLKILTELEQSPSIEFNVSFQDYWIQTRLLNQIMGYIPGDILKQCNFEVRDLVESILKTLYSTTGSTAMNRNYQQQHCNPPFVAGGRTQSGKSMYLVICLIVSISLRIPSILISNGVAERNDIFIKIKQYLNLCNFRSSTTRTDPSSNSSSTTARQISDTHLLVRPGKEGGLLWKNIQPVLNNGGSVVINHSHEQIKSATRAISKYREKKRDPHAKFMLLVDECDSMFRTKDGTQRMEIELHKLRRAGPSVTLLASATLVSMLLLLMKTDTKMNRLLLVNPPDSYYQVEDIKPLRCKYTNKNIFLEEEDKLIYSTDIPYYNSKVEALYEDAYSEQIGKKGVLLLDISNPRVNAPGNVTEMAEAVQKSFPKIMVITITGKKMSFRSSNDDEWQDQDRDVTFGQLLENIDETWGMQMPIFVFGMVKMLRSVSFRSSRRVPTHILLHLGKAHNVETIVQALGRATGNGHRGILRENGFEAATGLLSKADFNSAKKYQNYINEVYERVNREKKDLYESIVGEQFSFSSDFMHLQSRQLGKKLLEIELPSSFVKPPESICSESSDLDSSAFSDDDQEDHSYPIRQSMNLESLDNNLTKEVFLTIHSYCRRTPFCRGTEREVDLPLDVVTALYEDRVRSKPFERELRDAIKILISKGFLNVRYDDNGEERYRANPHVL